MNELPPGMDLPRSLADIDADFMTQLLRHRGVLDESNAIVSVEESGVGMTAGYFSAIKKMKCTYRTPVSANDAFVVKAWPELEIAPQETIAGMFARDIKGYQFEAATFYPRPKVYLADFDLAANRWALVMDDANAFSEQKLHENEMTLDEVMRMLPRLVDLAVTWEGCHEGEKSARLDALNVEHWASDNNLALYKQIMPGGAKLWDRLLAMSDSSLLQGQAWDQTFGPGIMERFTRTVDAFYGAIRPENGGTCTLSHGDLRGDNLFFCEPNADYPDGWLTIDFQLMFRGPVPSDLAYLMNSGSVLPEVYSASGREKVMRTFYEMFMAKTALYRDYTWERFEREYAVMSTSLLVYYIGFGASYLQAGTNNELGVRVEMGDKGETEADLMPEELRQRMWWRKVIANFRTTLADFGHYDLWQSLPENAGGMGPWFEVPARLRR